MLSAVGGGGRDPGWLVPCWSASSNSPAGRLLEYGSHGPGASDGCCSGAEDGCTCPQDCPSGSEDDYCDGVSDKICDLDCGSGRDPDCNPEEMASPATPSVTMTHAPILGEFPIIWDIGIGFLIVIIICGVYLFVKKLRKI